MPPNASPRSARSARRSGSARAAHTTAVVDAMRRIVRALRLAAQRTQSEAGISAAQLFVLRQLEDAPAHSLSDLAARTLTDRTSVADVVDRLAARGLVDRAPSTDDRRRTTIKLTAAGRRLLRSAPRPPTALLIAALSQLEPGELAGLARGLDRLTRHMRLAGEPTPMLFED
jgi:DNA-binding MarR family transcriptional regulator